VALKISNSSAGKGDSTVPKQKCGLIMPISTMPGYPESHWTDVRSIITDAVSEAQLEANLVSVTDEVTVIQKTIVQNLYDNPIVICDVSGKNPNVMFELGLRLAFDKPTIVLKDDETTFIFDTGTIEHLVYPKDLRFGKIVEFKTKLTAKIKATMEIASKDPKYSTFLKHFGKFTISKLDETEVTSQQFILDELQSMRQSVEMLNSRIAQTNRDSSLRRIAVLVNNPRHKTMEDLHKTFISSVRGIEKMVSSPTPNGKVRLEFTLSPDAPKNAESMILALSRTYPNPVSAMEDIDADSQS